MKRKFDLKKDFDFPRKKSANKWWPTIYCTNERIFIGVSLIIMKFSHVNGRPIYKVNREHWKENNSKFREEKYRINMDNMKDGNIVFCPVCGMPVDFRLWKSSIEPNFIPISLEKDRLC